MSEDLPKTELEHSRKCRVAPCAELKKAGASTTDYARESDAWREDHRPASAALFREKLMRGLEDAGKPTENLSVETMDDPGRFRVCLLGHVVLYMWARTLTELTNSVDEFVSRVSVTKAGIPDVPKTYEPFEFLGVPR